MSTVFASYVTVTGPRSDVHRLRAAARRRIPSRQVKRCGATQVPWSCEKLFRLHPELVVACGEPPRDDWHYLSHCGRIASWHCWRRFRFFVEIKNFQIHGVLRPLSGLYPDLCFVAAELCLDDGSVTSRWIHRRRIRTWEMPDSRYDRHWKAAAREFEIDDVEAAYEDDTVRDQAELAMIEDALAHWESSTITTLAGEGRSAAEGRKKEEHPLDSVRQAPDSAGLRDG